MFRSSGSPLSRRCVSPAPPHCRLMRRARSSSTEVTSLHPPTRQALPSWAARRRNMPELLRTAVVGIGHLGRHHARLLATMEGASLVAVVDTVRERAEDAAGATGARAATD